MRWFNHAPLKNAKKVNKKSHKKFPMLECAVECSPESLQSGFSAGECSPEFLQSGISAGECSPELQLSRKE